MNCEPHIIDFYSKEQQQKRLDKRIHMKRRLLSLPRIHQVRRFFIVWSYANREGRRSLVARLNYKMFHELPELPDYATVSGSSAGTSGWLSAGPNRIPSY